MSETQKKSPKVIVIVVVLIAVAVGAAAYFSGKLTGDKMSETQTAEAQIETEGTTETASAQPAAGEETASQETTEALKVPPAPLPPATIKPGNPVVAKLDGQEIKRLDVLNYIQTLPPETQQLPVNQLFPLATEQVINNRLIAEKAKKVDLSNDPLVKEQVKRATEQITRTVFVQKQIEKELTDERLQQAYKLYTENFEQPEEANARHILVDDEGKAKDLVKQLEGGADFAELAKENSKDNSAARGGDVGYFTKSDVVPEFAEAAFSLEKGEYTKKPVKSDFGYHIIKLEDKRLRPVPTFEQAKPFLAGQLRGALLEKIVQDWREDADVERFDINGDALKAAGEEPAAGE